jgi:hypothetical protein
MESKLATGIVWKVREDYSWIRVGDSMFLVATSEFARLNIVAVVGVEVVVDVNAAKYIANNGAKVVGYAI